jgi:drug/metabolite transporter (DMT)-like permease
MTDSPKTRLLIGAVLISFSLVFAKLATVPPTVSAFYRVAIGGMVLLVLTLVRRYHFTRQPAPWGLLVAAGVFFALDLGFWHSSIHYIGPGLSTLIASFQVFFMAGAGVLLFKQTLPKRQLIAIPLAILGLALITGLDWSSHSETYRWGIVFGLVTALTYASYLLTVR